MQLEQSFWVVESIAREVEVLAAVADLQTDARDRVVRVEKAERGPEEIDVGSNEYRTEVEEVSEGLYWEAGQGGVLAQERRQDRGCGDELDFVRVEDFLENAGVVVSVTMSQDHFIDEVGRDAELTQVLSGLGDEQYELKGGGSTITPR